MKKLLVDAQVFHTPAFHRGMGKYSLEFLRSLTEINTREKYWDSIEVLLSSKIPLKDEAATELDSVTSGAKIIKLALKKDSIRQSRNIMEHNRAVVDKYVTAQTNKDPDVSLDYLILSPMQGGISCTFPCGSNVNKVLICYDLIPYMFHNIYYQNPIARIENLTKLTELLKADTYLTISKTVAEDLTKNFGVDSDRVHSIDGGPINHGLQPQRIAVNKPFVLMPTGNDLRKNNRTGILGFDEFNKRHNHKYELVITSFFDPAEVNELSKLSKNVTFTGNISGGELEYLYEQCEALLFPSEYEGLGLPVLEAVEKDKPVACSDISVFKEMSDNAFAYFNPSLGTSIAKALEQALSKRPDKKQYKKIKEEYTWQQTATKAIRAMHEHKSIVDISSKPKVAFFGLSSESDHPLADVMQTLYAEISHFFLSRYFLEGNNPAGIYAKPDILAYSKDSLVSTTNLPVTLKAQELPIYNLLNSELLPMTLFTALAHPGIAMLYDLDLSNLWSRMLEVGLIDESRLESEKQLQKLYSGPKTKLLISVIARQKGIVVFDKDAEAEINKLQHSIQTDIPIYLLTQPTSDKHSRRTFAKELFNVVQEQTQK